MKETIEKLRLDKLDLSRNIAETSDEHLTTDMDLKQSCKMNKKEAKRNKTEVEQLNKEVAGDKNLNLKVVDAKVRRTITKINLSHPDIREKMSPSEQKVYDRYV